MHTFVPRRVLAAFAATLALLVPAPAAVLVDLDAAKLPAGDLTACTADGTAAAAFSAGGTRSISAGSVSGRPAVTFTGADWLTSSFPAPAGLTGRHAFTVAVWAFNPEVGGEEGMVQWARRGADARSAQLNYGTAAQSGALTHWGRADLGYKSAVPKAGQWHHIAVTYAGGDRGLERLYVDGKAVNEGERSLNLWPDGPINVGAAIEGQPFTGSLAAVQMFDQALAADDIATLAGGGAPSAKPLVDLAATGLAEGPLTVWTNRGTAGGAFKRASIPSVGTAGGRAAILFDGRQNLVTDAAGAAPAAGAAFTVEAWIFNPALGNAETYASYTAQRGESVDFNMGRGPVDSAFSAAFRGLAFEVPPSPDAWHHVAVTYGGGAQGDVKVFVDGERDVEAKMAVQVAAGAKLVVGGGGRRGLSGALARLRIHDTALSQFELRRGCGLANAFNPAPRSGTTVDTLKGTLVWERGTEGVAGYRVFFGPDRAAVERRDITLVAGTPTAGETRIRDVPLRVGTTYYWRVDQLDARGSNAWPGVVWSFTVDAGRAAQPVPRDHTANTAADTRRLSWLPGRFATRQIVFFGTNEAEVAAATVPSVPNLAAGANGCAVPVALQPGTRYYWRVDSDNGDQPPTKGAVWAFRTQDPVVTNDVTFFVISDVHYNPDPQSYAGVRMTIDAMNWLPGTEYPKEFGGTVKTPRGVLLTGDMIDSGGAPWAEEVWGIFTNDFGVNGEGRVAYPVFETVGNHDAGDGCPPQEGVKARNHLRKNLTGISENGLHYSWDWDRYHMVSLNKYSGSGMDPARPFNQSWNSPTHSLEFLREDLAKQVGSSGRPVILYQHYGFDGFSAGWGWWDENDRKQTWDAIRDYNVVAYLHGHTHAMTFMKWKGEDFHKEGQHMPEDGIDIIGCASGQRGPGVAGEFMVFRMVGNEVLVAHRFTDHWGETRRIPIPAAPHFARPAAK